MRKTVRGFTLVELLIVIAILGSMAAIVTFRFVGVQGSGRDAKRKAELKQYQNAYEIFATTNDTSYPSTVEGVVDADQFCDGTLFSSDCPLDPKDGEGTFGYKYVSDGSGVDDDATRYILFAELERSISGSTEYFVLCSNGRVGISTVEPADSDCSSLTLN